MNPADTARDEQARKSAQSVFDRPLLVEAGAGTGKTATLVNRIVAWLLTRGWELAASRETEGERARIAALALEGTVAITFTDAAAAEMATRVEAGLAAYAEGDLERLKGFDPSLLDVDEAEGRLRARVLIASLDRLVIRTIHAWCRRLLARYPVEAGLGADFDVDADGKIAERAAREVLEEELPKIYADPELGPVALSLTRAKIGPDSLQDALISLSTNALPGDELESDGCDAGVVAGLRAMIDAPLASLSSGFEGLGDKKASLSDLTRKTLVELGRIRDAMAEPESDASQWIAGVSAALTSVESSLKRLKSWTDKGLVKQDSKLIGDAALDARIVAAAEVLQPVIKELSKLDYPGFEERRAMLRHLYPRMLERVRSAGYLTFGELLRGVQALFTEKPAVLDEVRRGMDHLLVDEFQDTDALQCALVERIAFEGAEDERPALFVVGDPKQSIYAWREADLGAYDAFKHKVEDMGGEVHGLYVNYRSTAQVLAEVSAVIRPLMHEEEGVQPAFQELLPGRENPDGGPVEHWISWDDEEDRDREKTSSDRATEIEAAAIAREMRARKAEGGSYGKMAVLLRATSKIDTLLEAFREYDVPYVVARDRSYYRRREIIDAAALVRAILDPGDMVALLAWLRSPAVGAPDATLAFLWSAGLPAPLTTLGCEDEDQAVGAREAAHAAIDAVHEELARLDQQALGLDLVRHWPAMLHAAVETLAALRVSFRTEPADLFVEKLRRLSLVEGAEAARYLAPFRVANLERFFGELVSALDLDRGNVGELLRGLKHAVAASIEAEEARPETITAEAVHVLTIHRSKGLDFDEVYVPQLHRGGRPGGADKKSAAKERAGHWEVKLLGKSSPRSFLHHAQDDHIAEAERVRLLYVAMTRARERLVLAGNWFNRDTRPEAMVRLLLNREGSLPDLGTLFGEALEDPARVFDEAGARWRFPITQLRSRLQERDDADARAPLETAALLAGAERLAKERASARDLQEQRASMPISRLAHEVFREERSREIDEGAEERESVDASSREAPGETRSGAAPKRLAGSVVHRILERVDLTRPLIDGLQDALDVGAAHARGLGTNEDEDRHAWTIAAELIRGVMAGPLPSRFDAIREHVLARELPLLVPPGEGDEHLYASGVIDLVYRDPESGEVVVADYKTDKGDVDEAIETYAPQLEHYARALMEAWELETMPRRELWLLRHGVTEACRP